MSRLYRQQSDFSDDYLRLPSLKGRVTSDSPKQSRQGMASSAEKHQLMQIRNLERRAMYSTTPREVTNMELRRHSTGQHRYDGLMSLSNHHQHQMREHRQHHREISTRGNSRNATMPPRHHDIMPTYEGMAMRTNDNNNNNNVKQHTRDFVAVDELNAQRMLFGQHGIKNDERTQRNIKYRSPFYTHPNLAQNAKHIASLQQNTKEQQRKLELNQHRTKTIDEHEDMEMVSPTEKSVKKCLEWLNKWFTNASIQDQTNASIQDQASAAEMEDGGMLVLSRVS